MNKKIAITLALSFLLLFSGCNGTPTDTEPSSLPVSVPEESQETGQQNIKEPLAAVAVPVITEKTVSEDDTEIFSYSYQNISLTLPDPEVADKIILDFLNRTDADRTAAKTILSAAREAYAASEQWTPYASRLIYNPTRIDQGVLSMFGSSVSYMGGNHPQRVNLSVSYDLLHGDVLTLAGILDIGARKEALRDLVIAQLESVKEEKYLYPDFSESVTQRFALDESRDESFFFTETGLCFYFEPYEIAPYASGTIVAEIPYTQLNGILHPSYFPTEFGKTQDSLQILPFNEHKLEELNQIAELVLDPEGQMVFICTEGTVHNIRLQMSTDNHTTVTLMAANTLGKGDALMVQAPGEHLAQITVNYENQEGLHSIPVLPE